MKKMILALAAMVLTTTMSAQNEETGKQERKPMDRTEMAKHRTDETVKRLGLNDEQAAQLLELNLKYADKMGRPNMRGPRGGQGRHPQMAGRRGLELSDSAMQKAERTMDKGLKVKPRGNRGQGQVDMRAGMEAYDEELKSILTEEQYNTYKTSMARRMGDGMRRHRGEARPDKKSEQTE